MPGRAVSGALRTVPRLRLQRWLTWFLGAIAIAAATYLVGFAIFASHVAGLKTPVDPPSADAIVVLTGGQARIEAAVDLLRSGKARRLLISGVHPKTRKRALQKVTGADTALFACCVDMDRVALDTIGNAVESAKWMTEQGFVSAIVVTNNYHIPRSLLEMRREYRGIELYPYPVVNSDLDNGGWLTKPNALRVLFTEYGKYVMALARG